MTETNLTKPITSHDIIQSIKDGGVTEYKLRQIALRLITALRDEDCLLYYHGEDGLYWEEKKLRVTQEELDLVYD